MLNIYELISKCSNDVLQIDDLYYMVLKLAAGKTSTFYALAGDDYKQSINLSITCVDGQTGDVKTDGPLSGTDTKYFWNMTPQPRKGTHPNFDDPELGQSPKVDPTAVDDLGLKFYAIVDKYSPTTQSVAILSSPIAFFTGFVLVIGTALAGMFSDFGLKLWLTDMPNAEKILRICDGITSAQVEGDLIREGELYWELVDIMRSPEVLKQITGSYLHFMREKAAGDKSKGLDEGKKGKKKDEDSG